MKNMKKVLALVLALVMILSTAVTVSAAPEAPTDGSITVRNATIGKDYTAYKLFDLTYEEPIVYDLEGLATSPVAYTYTAHAPAEKIDVIGSAKGDDPLTEAVEAADHEYTVYGDKFLENMKASTSPFEVVATSTPNVYNISLKESVQESEDPAATVTDFLKANVDNFTAAKYGRKVATKNATSETVKFSELGYGYYYVTSGLGSEVTIDSTMKDVEIVDKNEEPTIPNTPTDDPEDPENPGPNDPKHPSPYVAYPGKVIVTNDVDETTGKVILSKTDDSNYGDYVHFGYSLDAVSYADPVDEYVDDVLNADKKEEGDETNADQNKTGLVTYYYIEDIMEKGFDMVTADIKDSSNKVIVAAPVVRVIKKDKDGKLTTQVLVEGKDYTIRYTESADGANIANATDANEAFQIAIPWGEKYGSNATITVDYYALVTEKAVIAANGNPNKANFSYEVDEDFDPDDTDPDNPKDVQEENEDYNEYMDPKNHPDGWKPSRTEGGDDYDPELDPEDDEYDEEKFAENTPYLPDENPAYDPKNPTPDAEHPNPDYPEDPYMPKDDSGNPDPTVPFDPNAEEEGVNPTYNDDTEDETHTYVYALGIQKVDEKGDALATAYFNLEKQNVAEDGTVTWTPVYVKDSSDTTDADGVYMLDTTTAAPVGDAKDTRTNEVQTPATGAVKGQIVVMGLEEGTYRFTETQAPKGYNLATAPFEYVVKETGVDENAEGGPDWSSAYAVSFKATASEGEEKTYTLSVPTLPRAIENKQGIELPSTGGIGTKLFYMGGGILVLGAAVLLITKKRTNA